jgi:2-succinyl-5-enolpyruvyl-6-hydroxy-3-cyclohexene-1-carboxylate synthase
MQEHVFWIAATCKQLGIKHVVMSPGSRSAPLVFAFANNPFFTIHTLVDERSAAYVALGMAQQIKKPVVLFCTSGTAAANYLPAITEAYYQRIPLLVLTADRPAHLLNQQDGQMINQQQLFGSHVRYFNQLDPSNEQETIRVIGEAIFKCNGLIKGPVHINLPFTEPLYPNKITQKSIAQIEVKTQRWIDKHKHHSLEKNTDVELSALEQAWISSSKRLLLIGQGVMHEKWITPLLDIEKNNDVVIVADVVSNKHQFNTVNGFDKMISGVGAKQRKNLEPDFILSVGGPLLSKSLKQWLSKQKPAHHFRIQTEPENINTYGNVTQVIHTNPTHVLNHLSAIRWSANASKPFVLAWKQTHQLIAKQVEKFIQKNVWSEMHVMNRVLNNIPDGSNVHLANSSMVRYVSWLGKVNDSWIMSSNRGTSGIDGCTSTAVGAALVNLRPTVLLTGDLAFLYDRNGLWLNHIPDNLRIIVFNNNGGGIFTLIEGPSKHKNSERYFTTPTPQQISLTAQQSGLDYYFCKDYKQLDKTLEQFFNPLNKAGVLELSFDMKHNAKVFEQFKNINIK